MRRFGMYAFLIMSVLLVGSPLLLADQIFVGDVVSVARGDFVFDAASGQGWGQYVITAPSSDVFPTFCVELTEEAAGTMRVGDITPAANGGGINVVYGGDPSPDPLGNLTAYLYTQFRANALSGYNYGTDDSAAALQFAIWVLEEERALADVPAAYLAQVNAWIAEANSAVTAGWGGVTGLGDVRVMNFLKGADFEDLGQDMLVLVPEPASLLLLGTGLVFLAGFARRFGKR